MTPLCATRPSEWWEPADPGARLALALCRVCPALPSCLDGDPRPYGVIRAAAAWSDEGKPLPICACGYPNCSDQKMRRPYLLCSRCRPPRIRIMSVKAYDRLRQKRKRQEAKAA